MLLSNLTLFSQKLVLDNQTGDTLIAISPLQAKYLMKKYYRVESLRKTDSICEKQRVLADSVIKWYKLSFDDQKLILTNKTSELSLSNEQIQKLNDDLKTATIKTKKQIAYKWISIVAGSITTGFMGYLAVTR